MTWFETSSRGALNLQKVLERLVREIYEKEGIQAASIGGEGWEGGEREGENH